MPRRPRCDTPGSWHHVLNRAIAKRPYFEARSDKRYFLARLAREVRAGRIEVHAYSLMTTHFHLLVRSPIGEMSEGMRLIQNAYSRFFNRRRRRDGPLIRARFYSKVIDSETYCRAVVRYIDFNAVRAKVVSSAEDHEFGSARFFLQAACPPWLSTDWIESCSRGASRSKSLTRAGYLSAFGSRGEEDLNSLANLVEVRMASSSQLDPLDDLIGKKPAQVRRWLARKARLADGMEIGLPVSVPADVLRAVQSQLDAGGEWIVGHGSKPWLGSQVSRVGLLRDLCALPYARIARLCDISDWVLNRHIEVHRQSVLEDRPYAERVSAIAHEALALTIPK
tara:strand:+ start:83 stop:1093 length:1011 start_codon:yes stop_codon:yes gene_type:complete